jgi:acetolactate synthase-1/2/3 large subunit
MIKLSDYVFQFVRDQGVKHVFMVAGGGAMHLNDSAGHCEGLQIISNMHEQAAAMAAETYAKLTGDLGVALVTTGPGGTNTVTGVAGAWLDSTPCLFISGQTKRNDLVGDSGVRQSGVQELPIVQIVKPITKYAETVMEPERIRYHLEKAVYLARYGRPGPVWIDSPLDVQASQIDENNLVGFSVEEPNPLFDKEKMESQMERVIELLNQADRPVLFFGNGVRLANAVNDVVKLIDRLKIPVLTTWLGMDIIPDSNPYYIGRPGSIAPRGANFTIQNADLLLVIGARLDMVTVGYDHQRLARAAKKIMVDIDEAEIRKMKTPLEVAIQADAGAFIQALLRRADQIDRKDTSDWLKRCLEWKEKYPVVQPEYRAEKEYVNTYVFSEAMHEALPEDELIVSGSSGAGIEIFQLAYKVKSGQRVLMTSALGAMGNGLPSCIGASVAAGRERVISVDGDGGFQLNIQELEVIRRLNLPIKLFILNNSGYASIRTSQMRYFGRLSGADETSGFTVPSLARIAEAFCLSYDCIEHQDHLVEDIQRVIATPGAVLCEVMIAPSEPRAPSLSSRVRKNGTMVSKPLEDLWPFLDREEFLSNMIIPAIDEPEE